MSAGWLRELRAAATPGEWRVDAYDDGLDVRAPEHAVARLAGVMTMGEDADPGVKARALADAELIALAPDLAELCADMADLIAEYSAGFADCDCEECARRRDLLARLAAIQPKGQRA